MTRHTPTRFALHVEFHFGVGTAWLAVNSLAILCSSNLRVISFKVLTLLA